MPTASATSQRPPATASQACWKAEEALAQAFSRLCTGMPSMPAAPSTTWPLTHSCPVSGAGGGLQRLALPPRVGEGRPDRLAREVLQAALQELAKLGHTDADD